MFKLHSSFKPTGDQPEAIEKLVEGLEKGVKEQVLMGVTGSGKTYTMANVIERVNKPTLVLAHNKTLAGQLYAEFKEFFPENAVEYFVSYYDYYQPEAYVVSSDTYIEKEATINDEIDELRHSATMSILDRRDVIVIASVSCIYGIGDPDDYRNSLILLRVGDKITRKELLKKLVNNLFTRAEMDLDRGTFKIKGDTIEILPTYERTNAIRVEFEFDQIVRIREFDIVTKKPINDLEIVTVYPATQFVTNKDKLDEALNRIEAELEERLKYFRDKGLLLEAERIEKRTRYDIELLREIGSCAGVENYSRHLALREEGETPSVLIDFFPDDFLLIIDESHVTIPQIRGMYNGDRSRKASLIEYGFRLPSALDNRPLNFSEFEKKINKVVYVSATPGDYEQRNNNPVIEQIIRPTGLLDPKVFIRPSVNQIDDVIEEIELAKKRGFRVLITTLTIKMSEDLTTFLKSLDYKVAYLHSEIKTLERLEIIRELRLGKYDVLVGINLLREGLDIPEVSTILILDADKEGFLRSERSLIQTIGRAARNSEGKVILYADTVTDSIQKAMNETNRRRQIQENYNIEHNITPTTIIKEIKDSIKIKSETSDVELNGYLKLSDKQKQKLLKDLEKEMNQAAKNLDFEKAMELRDIIFEIKSGE